MRNARKVRNPRYAPEFLERKLSPSSFSGSLTLTAEVCLMAANDAEVDPNTIPGTTTPPDIEPAGPPTGPVLPA